MKEMPKVLVVSTNAWIDNSQINTLIELFKTWGADQLAQIYTKSALPNTVVCKSFLQIAEERVLRSVFDRRISTTTAIQPDYQMTEEDKLQAAAEGKRYKKAGGSFLLSICREVVWLLGKWKTQQLDAFIEEQTPDILFFPVYPTIYMCRLQLYVKKKVNKPSVCYISDDNYTYKPLGGNVLKIIHRFFLRKKVKKLIDGCDKLMVIAPKQKEEYDRLFHKDSVIITKGIDCSDYREQLSVNEPIKMLYSGSMIIGRDRTIKLLVDEMGTVNRNGIKISLDIYTAQAITPKMKEKFNRNGCSIHAAVPYNEIMSLQSEADVLLFVEGLDNKNKNVARLSFSTKITDYLKAGKCIFAIGDGEIAPIDYLLKKDAALVATNIEEIRAILNRITEDDELILQYGRKSHLCGVENHNREKMDCRFKKEMLSVLEGRQ